MVIKVICIESHNDDDNTYPNIGITKDTLYEAIIAKDGYIILDYSGDVIIGYFNSKYFEILSDWRQERINDILDD